MPCNIFVDGTDPRDVSCVYHNEYGLRIVVLTDVQFQKIPG